jgi:prepilin-type N-terminal cleavage/methylation domain-containing protein
MISRDPFPADRQRGLSLVELLVGLVAASIVTALSYKAYLSFNRQSLAQNRIAAGQSELLPIQAALEENLRRAGFKLPLKVARRAGAAVDTVQSVTVSPSGSGPNGIIIKGNFSEVSTRTLTPFPAAAAHMDVLPGTASQFRAGDTVLVGDREFREYLAVNAVDTVNSRLTTGPRLNDYSCGVNVLKVNTVLFQPAGNDLYLTVDGKPHRLTANLTDLRFAFIKHDGLTVSAAPFDPEGVQFIQYQVEIRIPKPGGRGYFQRRATGKILPRNLQ